MRGKTRFKNNLSSKSALIFSFIFQGFFRGDEVIWRPSVGKPTSKVFFFLRNSMRCNAG